MSSQEIEYSEKYFDDEFEYRCCRHICFLTSHLKMRASPLTLSRDGRRARRHVILPKQIAKNAPKGRMLTETEWRGIGVQQSRGWVHYAIHRWTQTPQYPTPASASGTCG